MSGSHGSPTDRRATRQLPSTLSSSVAMLSVFPVLLLALSVKASILTLQSPRIVVTDSTGSQLRSEPYVSSLGSSWYIILTGYALLKLCRISLAHKISTPVQLLGKETLKFTFQVVDKDSGKGVQPHQTFLRFYDEKTNEEGIQPVRVTPGGKAKFELVRLPFLLTKYNSKSPSRTCLDHHYHYPPHLTAIHLKSPFSSGPRNMTLFLLKYLISFYPARILPQSIPKRLHSTSVPRSNTRSVQTTNFLHNSFQQHL